ncbi:TetR family transcriptional regulator [Reticulibacter mediterranei]|uniref:TetR family transcriptional regulator n=1 Tax=Reticulibacter mediterranei TaxID=2778369 RepID=A0A8J3IMX5_9CHLR|nr:TetR/AcrR family transcriptional regulator [Reticulibacter mediterranei]GHO97008.1 TetR family transcriptional regulator [Reticulibacter mediterranei]
MKKWERTHHNIIARAAPLFNQRGFSGTSLQDIMEATGLRKGGIYSHFENKEQLAEAAFEYSCQLMEERMREFLSRVPRTATDQLQAVVEAFATVAFDPPVAGGCAMLNTAVESDDAYPALKQKVRYSMDAWMALVQKIVSRGIERQELSPETDGAEVATLLISTLEGALMLSKLYDDFRHMERAVAHLRSFIQTLANK